LCKPIPLCQRYLAGEELSKAELDMVFIKTEEYRKRLMSISWFMKNSSGKNFHASPHG